MTDLGFIHVFHPPADQDAPVLLALHGTGGNEHDLVPLAQMLAPSGGVLSPRGKVLERGMPRFFRRLAEGVFDLDDLKLRTAELADFATRAAAHYGLTGHRIIAVGFSNGANIAASVLLLRPGVLSGGVLFRAMVPLMPDPLPSLNGTPVFVSGGERDPLIPVEGTERLADLLRDAGADVTLVWQPVGHQLTQADVTQAREWLSARGF